MMEEHCWIDVGEVAHWWGGEKNEPTCHARAGAKPSRIDGIVCNLEAATLIHSFEVEKDEMIPTHSIIKVKVSRNAMTQKKSVIGNLPSLKKAFDMKIEEDIEQMEEKEKEKMPDKVRNKFGRMQKEELHQAIDRHYEVKNEEIDEALRRGDMNRVWELWSRALERGYLEHLNESKEVTKNMMGRGKVNIVEKTPQRRELAETVEDIRKGGSRRAVRFLKQARRCEQVAYRLELIKLQPDDAKVGS